MRIDPTKKTEKQPAKMDEYNRKAALMVAFIAIYFFLFKILFL